MPYADSAATARHWAHDRAVDLWAFFAADFDMETLHILAGEMVEVRRDGARIVMIVPNGSEASADERSLPNLTVYGPTAPSPFGLFAALQAAGIPDTRRLGVVGSSPASLRAARRAGAGAVIGLAAATSVARLQLLPAEPDAIVTPGEFAALDAQSFSSGRAHRQRVLLNPGPAVVSDRVHRAVGGPDLCHREPEYSELFARVRQKLLTVAGVDDDWALVMLAGSGTAAMEAMTGAAVRPGHKLLVCRNGIYGERIETIARRSGTEVVVVEASPLEPIEPDAVAEALGRHGDIDAVAVVHHETTTGLLNPVHEIAAAAQKTGALVLVDAISSLGAEQLCLAGTGIDFVASTSNKCLHGLPGAAFVLVSPRGQERVESVPPRSLYFDLTTYLRAQARDTVPFTPAIPAMYGLEAALDELLDEGIEHRQRSYRERAEFLDDAFERLGIAPLVASPHRSHSVRTLPLPADVEYVDLHDALKAEGYIIYAGLGDAARTTFRVCALGALTVEALAGFIQELEKVLSRKSIAAAGVVR